MTTKLETETGAYKTIEAYKKAASEAGLVLKSGMGHEHDNGDFPLHAFVGLKYIRRVNAIGKDHKKIVTTMSRALIRDENNSKPTKREVLWYSGYFSGTTHKGEEYHANFEIGKHLVPKIISNPNLTYNQRTGDPIGSEKILSGQETVYEIEVPQDKKERKKLVDSILGDGEGNDPSNVLYYVRHMMDQHNYQQSRDDSFTYEEFVNYSIEELLDTSQRGAGGKSPKYYTDPEGKLRFKRNNALVPSASNKPVYQ